MSEGIDEIDWARLGSCHGSAETIPDRHRCIEEVRSSQLGPPPAPVIVGAPR